MSNHDLYRPEATFIPVCPSCKDINTSSAGNLHSDIVQHRCESCGWLWYESKKDRSINRIKAEAVREWVDSVDRILSGEYDGNSPGMTVEYLLSEARVYAEKLERGEQ